MIPLHGHHPPMSVIWDRAALPEPLDTCLPSIEQIEAELGRIGEEES